MKYLMFKKVYRLILFILQCGIVHQCCLSTAAAIV